MGRSLTWCPPFDPLTIMYIAQLYSPWTHVWLSPTILLLRVTTIMDDHFTKSPHEKTCTYKQIWPYRTCLLVEEVELLNVNPTYAFVRHNDGRESTVSLRDLAPPGNNTDRNDRTNVLSKITFSLKLLLKNPVCRVPMCIQHKLLIWLIILQVMISPTVVRIMVILVLRITSRIVAKIPFLVS